ncbi:long-chain fatty alcohol dehydrogenase [Xylaria bambusicola]|uniref:long-chain fatty alcohol dehydrogenase n=1 Tax=Xylaria bambusicola TaxID=326684 RepID=UPI0020074866|nr:long-chain fatty alcohol dehydrogenase [Xylaria bambusicola]KAI0502914.1 long-chain fatty alcohol dehydrogenase [Xylaria bambusicola]
MASRPSDDPKLVATVERTVEHFPPSAKSQLRFILNLMLTRLGSIISTGYWTTLVEQPLSVRAAILQSWKRSWFSLWPALVRIFIAITKTCWSQTNKLYLQLNGHEPYNIEVAPGVEAALKFIEFQEPIEAAVLAEAGLRVVVVDRGYHFAPEDFPLALNRADDVMRSLTPNYVRDEWARGGLTFLKEEQSQNHLDRVCEAMGVSDATIQANHGNQILLEGSRDSCGLGCHTGTKQSSASFWLPAAARAGARFIEGLDIHQVLFYGNAASRAMGVMGQWTSRDDDGVANSSKPKTQRMVQIHTKTVILASGALNTPLLMKMTGLENPNIGRNLHLHPVANIMATWDQEIKPWEGDMLSSVVTEFEDLDRAGHGAKVSSLAMQPYIAILFNPWRNSIDFKVSALQYRHMTCHISLCRDRDPGSVSAEPIDGSPIINYTPSKFDRAHIATGLVAAAKLCYLSGARSLAPAVPDVPHFECDQLPNVSRSLDDGEFADWIRKLEKTSLDPARTTFNSAHQMGTTRMGTSAETSVVYANGRVWGCENLYVADTSVFPSASGVNPMVTVMAIADRIACGIAAKLN